MQKRAHGWNVVPESKSYFLYFIQDRNSQVEKSQLLALSLQSHETCPEGQDLFAHIAL